MVKKLVMLTVAALATLLPLSVSAEQPAAYKYRKMIESGKFFIEYHSEVDKGKKSTMRGTFEANIVNFGRKLAYNGEDKKVYINKKTGGRRSLDYVKNPLGTADIFMMKVHYLPLASYQNGKIAEESYFLYYDETKNLKYVKENTTDTAKIIAPNGMVTKMAKPDGLYLLIENFSSDIPVGFFDFPKGCKVYRMDLGTIEDLLEMPPLVESY